MIKRIAVNSQTVRIVFDDKVVDYKAGYAAPGHMMKFLNGRPDEDVIFKYESKEVSLTDDFTWKSDSDGCGKINYVDRNKREQVAKTSRVDYNYYSSTQNLNVTPRPSRIQFISTPTTDINNKREFKKIFGGNK